jgi:hypothetical protein
MCVGGECFWQQKDGKANCQRHQDADEQYQRLNSQKVEQVSKTISMTKLAVMVF